MRPCRTSFQIACRETFRSRAASACEIQAATSKAEYVNWFMPFASEIFRVLAKNGRFVLNIGGSYNKGTPTRSLYHFKLFIELVERQKFHLAQECFWYNPANVIEGEIPTEMLVFGNNAANDNYTLQCKEAGIKIHPARFPAALPEFFIKLLTAEGDTILDPFAGSNTTGAVAERLGRRWIAVDIVEEYLAASRYRFDGQLRLL